MTDIQILNNVEEFHDYRDNGGEELRIVKLSAPWCAPCRALNETIKNLDPEKINGAVFAEVDIDTDDTEAIGVECGVRGVPVLLFYKGGEEKKRTVGIQTADTIYKIISELA